MCFVARLLCDWVDCSCLRLQDAREIQRVESGQRKPSVGGVVRQEASSIVDVRVYVAMLV